MARQNTLEQELYEALTKEYKRLKVQLRKIVPHFVGVSIGKKGEMYIIKIMVRKMPSGKVAPSITLNTKSLGSVKLLAEFKLSDMRLQ